MNSILKMIKIRKKIKIKINLEDNDEIFDDNIENKYNINKFYNMKNLPALKIEMPKRSSKNLFWIQILK